MTSSTRPKRVTVRKPSAGPAGDGSPRGRSRNLWPVTGGTETAGRAVPDSPRLGIGTATREPGSPARESEHAPVHEFAYRAALDGLRAVAVLWVIAYHDNY